MQTINRNNYEEYFLLYADNELDAGTKLAVENFAQQNTDLVVELEMLMQTKLKPEEFLFDDKEILMRTEGNSINETNHEEYFLLYIDNELSAAKRAEVERYVLQHPALQNEFITLKQAVFPVENISYGNKENLYKTEKRVIYFKPWKIAAAAIFIGVCAVGVWLMQKPASVNTVAETHPQQLHQTKINEQAKASNHTKTITPVTKPVDTIKQLQQPEQTETVTQQSSPIKQTKIIDKKAVIKKNDVALPEDKEADVANRILNQQDKEYKTIYDNNIVKQDQEPVTDDDKDVAIETLPSGKKIITTSPQNNLSSTADENNNGYKIYNVAYKEINPNNDDNSLHVGAFDLNKNKVKTLLKKAGRLFSSKQNNSTDNDKLQIANFKINTINQ